MCRLFPCIPSFRGERGGGGRLIKKCENNVCVCVCVLVLKIALVVVKNVCFGVKKGMSELGC